MKKYLALLLAIFLISPKNSLANISTDPDEGVIGTVNGESLLLSEYKRLVSAQKKSFHRNLDFDLLSKKSETLKKREEQLKKAKSEGLSVNHEDFSTAWDDLLKTYNGINNLEQLGKKNSLLLVDIQRKLEDNLLLDKYFDKHIKEKLLQVMVDEVIVLQEARTRNLEVPEELVIKKLEMIEDKQGGEESFRKFLAENNATIEEAKEEVKNQFLYEFVKEDVSKELHTTNKEKIKDYFASKKDNSKVIIYDERIPGPKITLAKLVSEKKVKPQEELIKEHGLATGKPEIHTPIEESKVEQSKVSKEVVKEINDEIQNLKDQMAQINKDLQDKKEQREKELVANRVNAQQIHQKLLEEKISEEIKRNVEKQEKEAKEAQIALAKKQEAEAKEAKRIQLELTNKQEKEAKEAQIALAKKQEAEAKEQQQETLALAKKQKLEEKNKQSEMAVLAKKQEAEAKRAQMQLAKKQEKEAKELEQAKLALEKKQKAEEEKAKQAQIALAKKQIKGTKEQGQIALAKQQKLEEKNKQEQITAMKKQEAEAKRAQMQLAKKQEKEAKELEQATLALVKKQKAEEEKIRQAQIALAKKQEAEAKEAERSRLELAKKQEKESNKLAVINEVSDKKKSLIGSFDDMDKRFEDKRKASLKKKIDRYALVKAKEKQKEKLEQVVPGQPIAIETDSPQNEVSTTPPATGEQTYDISKELEQLRKKIEERRVSTK